MTSSLGRFAAALALALVVPNTLADDALPSPAAVLERVAELPYAELVDVQRSQVVRAHLVALGAMQKARGVWRPSASERADGILHRFTWRALDLFPAEELLAGVASELDRSAELQLLFSCEARACGSSAQWANRVFGQRILYGREDTQHYRAYAAEHGGNRYFLMLYASARSSDRQYLHAEVLELDQDQ